MEIIINDKKYNLYIERKNNKNMYLRVKNDGIYVTTNYLISDRKVIYFVESNYNFIEKASEKVLKKEKKKEEFYYLGKCYQVIIMNNASKIEFFDDRVFVKNKTYLSTFLSHEAERIFSDRLKECYSLFDENIPYPKMMVWKMKRKWGYCNKREKLIKLNFDLIKYSINEIDYVIIHELCHLIEFNHSRKFWSLVKKYMPNYKEAQKILKEE
jgi:predicted metal-dependent hydrolase